MSAAAENFGLIRCEICLAIVLSQAPFRHVASKMTLTWTRQESSRCEAVSRYLRKYKGFQLIIINTHMRTRDERSYRLALPETEFFFRPDAN